MVRKRFKKPHRAKRKKPLLARGAFWRSIGFTMVAGGAVWLVCFSPATEITEVNVAGTEKVDSQECARIIEGEINKKIALFDSKSILLFNLEQTKEELLARFPQIQDIKIERKFPSKIYASVEERQAVAIFRGEMGKWYSLDTEGFAFEEFAGDEGRLIRIIPAKEQKIDIGARVLDRELVEFILRAKGGAESASTILIKSAVIATPERINLETQEGWYAYLSPLKDVDEQLLKLVSVMEDESFKAKQNNLEYVDVRFTRVYLKEKEENPLNEEEDSPQEEIQVE